MTKKLSMLVLLSLIFSGCGKDPDSIMDGPTSTSNDKSASTEIGDGSGEGQVPQDVVSIPEELQKTFDSASEQYTVYGGGPEEGITNLIVEYSLDRDLPYENVARGLCDKTGSTPRIILYKYDWVEVGTVDYTRNYNQQKRSFYHLLGHCVFDLPHNDETMSVNFGNVDRTYPKSIMHSNWFGGMVPGDVRDQWLNNLIPQMWREIEER